MSKDALTFEDATIIPRASKQSKSTLNSHPNLTDGRLLATATSFLTESNGSQPDRYDDSKDFDADSGVSSLRQSRSKLAKSVSGGNIASDDELDDEELHPGTNSFSKRTDDQGRRISESSSITNFTIQKGSSEFNLNTRTSTTSSAQQSHTPIPFKTIPHAQSTPLSKTSNTHSTDSKGKSGGVRQLFRKIFRPSSSTSSKPGSSGKSPLINPSSPRINVDHANGTAYPAELQMPVTQGPIRLLVLRHGERLDRYYSSQWLRQAFDADGNFCRFSPILPETLPIRASIRDFDLDPPLTYKGLKDAYHTGTVLRDKNIQINYCYSSPSLRCVQTAAKILEGLQLHTKMKIRLEPGLFECTGWYVATESNKALLMPRFLTKKEFLENKYFIDKQYREQMTTSDISQAETELEFYQRSHSVTTSILNMHENEFIAQIQQGQMTPESNMHILFIAHAPSLETCTRKLCGGKFRPDTLPHVIRNVDYLTMTVIEKTDNNQEKWIFRRSSFYGDEF